MKPTQLLLVHSRATAPFAAADTAALVATPPRAPRLRHSPPSEPVGRAAIVQLTRSTRYFTVRAAATVSVALSFLSLAHGASLRTSVAGSGGVDLKAFGQAYPELSALETEFSLGFELWQAEADRLSCTLSARRTELHRTLTRWTGPVTPQTGVNAQGFWSAPLPDKLQDVGLELIWQHRFSPEWMLMIQARPGCRTAGTTTLVSDGFGATGSALAVWRLSESLQFAFGAAGDSLATGSQQLLPVAGLDWGFAEHWRLSLGVPRTGLFWQVSEALELGLAAEGGWNTYYVRQRDAATYPYGRPLTETKLEHVEGRAGIQANWNLTKAVQLNLSIGVVGVRRFEYPDRNLVLKSDDGHGGYGSLGVSVNF